MNGERQSECIFMTSGDSDMLSVGGGISDAWLMKFLHEDPCGGHGSTGAELG
jgi:hypothetical protein